MGKPLWVPKILSTAEILERLIPLAPVPQYVDDRGVLV
jgi:hypothetical protein